MKISVKPNQLNSLEVKEFYMTHSLGFNQQGGQPKDDKDDAYKEFGEVKYSYVENGRRAAIEAIVPFLPKIGAYEEESNIIVFDIAFGVYGYGINYYDSNNKTYVQNASTGIYQMINARFDHLHRLPISCNLTNEESIKEFSREISSVIRKTIPLCNNNHNLFVILYVSFDGNYYIDCGLYTSLPNSSSTVERQFISNRFVLAHSTRKNVVCLSGLDNVNMSSIPDIYAYNLTFDSIGCNSKAANIYEYDNDTARAWHGIFERVRRQVHGTICLIVGPSWKLSEDSNFDGSSNMDLSISLNYDLDNPDNNKSFENNVDLFISMLNFDGITVINSYGYIKAYNLFCKPQTANKPIMGGARRRAYEALKKSDYAKNYLGLYFQSQEGEIKFFKFKDNICYSYFDPNIMAVPNVNFGNLDIAEKNQKKMMEIDAQMGSNSVNVVQRSLELIRKMWDTHYGLSNFYLEPKAAQELMSYYLSNQNTIHKYQLVSCELISVAVVCLIGNAYGYSYDAANYYEEIIKNIPKNQWTLFFNNEYYYLNNLLYILLDINCFKRLKDIMNNKDLVSNIPNDYIKKVNSLDYQSLLKMYYKENDWRTNAPNLKVNEFDEDDYEDKEYC